MHNCLEMGTHVALSYQELRRDMGIDQFDCALIVLTKYQEFMHNYNLQPDLHSALTVISVLSVINLIGNMDKLTAYREHNCCSTTV